MQILPTLNSSLILSVAIQLVRQIPDDLYKQLIVHPFLSRKPRKYHTMNKNFKYNIPAKS
jgi:hypothetical protein